MQPVNDPYVGLKAYSILRLDWLSNNKYVFCVFDVLTNKNEKKKQRNENKKTTTDKKTDVAKKPMFVNKDYCVLAQNSESTQKKPTRKWILRSGVENLSPKILTGLFNPFECV